MARSSVVMAVAVCMLAACAGPRDFNMAPPAGPPASLDTEGAAAAPPAAKPALPTIDITPLTSYADGDRSSSKQGVPFANAYTRLLVSGHFHSKNGAGQAAADETKGYTERPALHRYFVGLKDDINVSVRVRTGNYEETASLVTLTSVSDRSGSAWDRDVTHDATSFPWFLVNRDAGAPVPQITTQFRGSRAMESGVATAILQASLAAIKTVSPQATVVTRLSEPGTRERAAAIDQVISKLFSTKIGETHRSDRVLTQWRQDGVITLALNIPDSAVDWDASLKRVGHWTIGFARPRPSLFSDWQICPTAEEALQCKKSFREAEAAAYQSKNAAAILSYPLVRSSNGDTTIKSYLMQQGWYTSAQTSFTGNQASDTVTANALCLSIVHAMLELGLNDVDSNLVTWAAMTGLPPSKAMHPTAWSAAACSAVTQQMPKS